ncbi:ANTAR domain-containing protein [Streptomyces sp. DvalAA-14]|uniref:GAF domain-containing protein n=1 Tax=unclassified Streptomyces TaxID=2593676 RepID=UPI00081B0CE7|nr:MULTISPECIES: GAF domain-containing protein [unclassified Streptomyces]MYS24245.1 GAF domain-containing protein [Streptomyces sp. SID4948]SCE44192.1 ANTAR domain-containing protein [Streptomyces sp. DvalAA-14]
MNRLRLVTDAFVGVTETFGASVDPLVLAERLVGHCVRLTGAGAAGLMMITARGRLRTVAVSDERAEVLEMLQLQTGEGPCVDCWRTGAAVEAPDLPAQADRWPQFVILAREAGFRGAYAVPVQVHEQQVGALNLLVDAPGTLSADDIALVTALAGVAVTAMMQWRSDPARPSDILTRIQSVISAKASLETALGMLAAGGGLTIAEAARTLRDYSRRGGIRPAAAAQSLLSRDLGLDEVLAAAPDGSRADPAS